MPLQPLPPDPEPTEAELAIYRKGNPGLDPKLLHLLANAKWRTARCQWDPNAFHIGSYASVDDHDAYLRTGLWHRIRRRVLDNAGRECAACDDPATEVHIRDYRPRVLAGLDDGALVALCQACLGRVYHLGKAQVWAEEERVLAELVARKDQRLGPDPE